MLKKFSLFFVFLAFSSFLFCQQPDSIHVKTYNKKLIPLILTSEALIYTGSMIYLNEAWYKNYPRTSFHFFDDSKEWLQMDKTAHAFTSYHAANYGYLVFRQTGLDDSKALAISSIQSCFFISSIELFDGFSKGWGASLSDLTANFSGVGLFAAQQYFWNEQKILLKYSFSSSGLAGYRPDVLGRNLPEQLIKDYNAQTFWLSANLKSIFNLNKFPSWLNIALGYGADGMLTGHAGDAMQNSYFQLERKRQYYFSLDLDLSRIKLKNKALKAVFRAINILKFPFPAVEISEKKFYFHPVFY